MLKPGYVIALEELLGAEDGPVDTCDLPVSNRTLRRWVAAGYADYNDAMARGNRHCLELTADGQAWARRRLDAANAAARRLLEALR